MAACVAWCESLFFIHLWGRTECKGGQAWLTGGRHALQTRVSCSSPGLIIVVVVLGVVQGGLQLPHASLQAPSGQHTPVSTSSLPWARHNGCAVQALLLL
jgi:hypothetical protein